MLDVMCAWCVAYNFHTWPLDHTCWRQFMALWGDWKMSQIMPFMKNISNHAFQFHCYYLSWHCWSSRQHGILDETSLESLDLVHIKRPQLSEVEHMLVCLHAVYIYVRGFVCFACVGFLFVLFFVSSCLFCFGGFLEWGEGNWTMKGCWMVLKVMQKSKNRTLAYVFCLSRCFIIWLIYLKVVWWLPCLSDPQSYINGSLVLLAHPTKKNRSVG